MQHQSILLFDLLAACAVRSQALMKYMNDEKVLNAFSRKLGDVLPVGAAGAAAAAAAPAAAARPAGGAPEINNILDAARWALWYRCTAVRWRVKRGTSTGNQLVPRNCHLAYQIRYRS